MRVKRKIIFETFIGSHLYGTSRPESDIDYCGVFFPSTEDLLGIQNCPGEWTENEKYSSGERNTAGDVDRKYFSVKKFLHLLGDGQSGPLEMLFSPKKLWVYPTRPFKGPWSEIISNKEIFLSKQSVNPFIGFAIAQAHKAVLKGENLNLIRGFIIFLEKYHPHQTLKEVITTEYLMCSDGPHQIKKIMTEGGIPAVEIAGKKYEFTQQIRYVLQKLKRIEKEYGTRSEAAAASTYDYKSLMHAYRLIEEGKMLLRDGEIRLPFDKERASFFLKIRNGDYKADYFEEIQQMLTELREIKEKSTLPEKPDYGKIDEMCQEILYRHLTGDWNLDPCYKEVYPTEDR